ncbi:LysR family transcriptional regulator [Geitlerinema sp. CS-897]|nr:LysR family transcriptional regulator [Geitlerinema sp. CS-897]
MTKIDDMELFVRVVKAGGLAAAGRQLGLSPASMTARLKALEARYATCLLNRNTRSISLTDAGHRFYEACLRVLAAIAEAEATFEVGKPELSGQLRVTAPSDFGRQFVAPALADFVREHPKVVPYLLLSEHTVDLIAEGFDLGVRLGNLPDSNLMMRSLTTENRRVVCASPKYLEQYGIPQQPQDLKHHRCLVMERLGEKFDRWCFKKESSSPAISTTIEVQAAFIGGDGAIVRQWALAGAGIALKSFWDIKRDLDAGRLIVLFDDYIVGAYSGDDRTVGLQLVYPSRKYLPRQVAGFMEYFTQYIHQSQSNRPDTKSCSQTC